MTVKCVDSYLVYPGRGQTAGTAVITGTRVAKTGQLFKMLEGIYDRAETECQIDISFTPTGGVQQNECKDLLLAHLRRPTGYSGNLVAERLQSVTTNRSGIGLLFLICGKQDTHHKLVVARFPADEGVLAEQRGNTLSIAFVERVFMRSAKAYKSVMYKCKTLDVGFWRGRAVDRQIDGPRETSRYWIEDFLASTLATAGAAGSRRLAMAVRGALSEAPLTIKEELVSVVRLV